jgi:hypothetical protein
VSTAATATLIVTIAVAMAGYFAKYMSERVLAQRTARLERINSQLSELYGPLLADFVLGNAVWAHFYERNSDRSGLMFSDVDGELVPRHAALWQRWIEAVFQPTNRRMTECVRSHAALLRENEMPPCLQELAAHVAAYDILIARWREPGFVPRTTVDLVPPDGYTFPREELAEYIVPAFSELKRDQQELLGKLNRWAPKSQRTTVATVGQNVATQRRTLSKSAPESGESK